MGELIFQLTEKSFLTRVFINPAVAVLAVSVFFNPMGMPFPDWGIASSLYQGETQ